MIYFKSRIVGIIALFWTRTNEYCSWSSLIYYNNVPIYTYNLYIFFKIERISAHVDLNEMRVVYWKPVYTIYITLDGDHNTALHNWNYTHSIILLWVGTLQTYLSIFMCVRCKMGTLCTAVYSIKIIINITYDIILYCCTYIYGGSHIHEECILLQRTWG